MLEESETGTNPQPLPPPPGVWWSADARGNSFTSSVISPGLIVPPLFTGQEKTNAVPAPPASSYPGYQPMRSMPTDLAQMELNLHHHVESGFNSLTRVLTDKSDRILDQLVRRLEGFEEKTEKGTKNAESKVTELREEIAKLSQENKAILKEIGVIKDSLRGLDLKMELVSGNIEEKRCQICRRQGTHGGSESRSPERKPAMPKRSLDLTSQESSGNGQQRRVQASTPSSQGHQSSPLIAGRARGSDKIILAQLESKDRQPPDLRDHPAFAGGQSDHPLTFSETPSEESRPRVVGDLHLFQTPSFSDGGWYNQAYGQ